MNVDAKLEELNTEMNSIALKEVERLARKILAEQPHLKEFIMCMGGYFFTDKEEIVNCAFQKSGDSYPYFKPLNDFIRKWDRVLGLTGNAMRFTSKSKIITDW